MLTKKFPSGPPVEYFRPVINPCDKRPPKPVPVSAPVYAADSAAGAMANEQPLSTAGSGTTSAPPDAAGGAGTGVGAGDAEGHSVTAGSSIAVFPGVKPIFRAVWHVV